MLADFDKARQYESITAKEAVDQIQDVVKQKNGGKLQREAAVQLFYRCLHCLWAAEEVCSTESNLQVRDTIVSQSSSELSCAHSVQQSTKVTT